MRPCTNTEAPYNRAERGGSLMPRRTESAIVILRHACALEQLAAQISSSIVKSKVHPCTRTEALYSPYSP